MLKKISYLLVAVVFLSCIYYLRYTQPVKIYNLCPDLEPRSVDITIVRSGRSLENRKLHLEAGKEEFYEVVWDMEQILFRRSPINPLRQLASIPAATPQAVPTKADHNYHIYFEFYNAGSEQCSGSFSYILGNWFYLDPVRRISLPLTAVAFNGVALGDTIWDLAK